MFDLESAINNWKRTFRRQAAFEDGFIADLEVHLRDLIEELKTEGHSDEDAFREASSRLGTAESLAPDYDKVKEYRLDRRSPWRPARFLPGLPWHYAKVAFRKIRRHKSFSVITVAGLAVGMACFLLLSTAIQFETSFDRFHEKAGRMYRVSVSDHGTDGAEYSLSVPEILSRVAAGGIPEVAAAGIVQRSRNGELRAGMNRFVENGLFADERFFHLFSFDLRRGDPASVLAAPNAIVLSERLANKLFGDEDPVGKSLKFRNPFLVCDLNVTGLVKEPPRNSHLQFDYLVSAASLAANADTADWFNSWSTAAFWTYIELKEGASPAFVARKLETLLQNGDGVKETRRVGVSLQPITEIHLKSRVAGDTASNNRIRSVRLFGSIALIILLIACINAMNLSTARASTRTKEICIRKVAGGKRTQLLGQFLGESYLFAGLALLLSVPLFYTGFPFFADFLGTGQTLSEIDTVPLVLSVLGTFLFVGFFSGLYPAIVLSGFQPAALLKRQFVRRTKGIGIRNVLVVLQFAAVIGLLIGAVVIAKQMRFIQNKNLGYDRRNVAILELKDDASKSAAAVLKARLEEYHGISSVSVSDSTPLRFGFSVGGSAVQREDGEMVKIDYNMAGVDGDFLEVYGIQAAAGRNFSSSSPADGDGAIVNEAFVRKMGWNEPIGRKVRNRTVIGVVEDFHYNTLHKEIEPAVFSPKPTTFGTLYLGVRFRPGDSSGVMAEIGAILDEIVSSPSFSLYLLSDAFDGQYREERRLAVMIGFLEGVAVILGAMGLYGLATFATQRRTKEIGIRKTLGASMFRILRLISAEFLVLIAVSNLIAWPAGYFLMRKWLQEYVYRCSFGLETLVLAGLGAMLIALVAVGLHTVKASSANPLDSLRYE